MKKALIHCAKVNRMGCRCLFSHNKSHLPPVYRMYRRDRSKEVHISHQVGGFYLTFGLPCNCAEVTFGFFRGSYAGHKSTLDENSSLVQFCIRSANIFSDIDLIVIFDI